MDFKKKIIRDVLRVIYRDDLSNKTELAVLLKNGSVVRGAFVELDEEVLSVSYGKGSFEIDWDNIIEILNMDKSLRNKFKFFDLIDTDGLFEFYKNFQVRNLNRKEATNWQQGFVAF